VVSLASFAPVEKVSVLVTDALFPTEGYAALAGRVGEIIS
jgi:hypothetical protein